MAITTLSLAMEHLSAFQETIAETPRESLRLPPKESGLEAALHTLRNRHHSAKALVFGSLLGKGGMGTVHLAEQRSVGRGIAVKGLLAPEQGEGFYTRALLQEGWVMAALEHPNIPPVHDIMLDEEGSPLVLLKRIEGDEWTKLMNNQELVRERFGEDLLTWNLDVLNHVCHALSYSHAKRIVHRDLKPENIMIGAFGEVYVLDWGIAVCLDRDPEGRLPFLGDSVQPAGTPCFMAPELLDPDPSGVGVATDVYLVGGMLYEALTGRPPHSGTGMEALAKSIVASTPSFPVEIPDALIAICQRAMQASPADRYSSIGELQHALRDYLKRRNSQRLTAEANERLQRLRELAASPRALPSQDMPVLYSEARFAFQQALASYPDDEGAKDGLRDAAEVMVRCELAEDRVHAASAFLGEIESPDPALVRQVEAATQRDEEEKRRLKKLDKQQDGVLDTGKRVVISLMFSTIVAVGAFAGELISDTPLYTHGVIFAWQAALLASFVPLSRAVNLAYTEQNRLTKAVLLTALISEVIGTGVAWAAGLSIHMTILLNSIGWMAASVTALLAMGVVYLPTTLAFAILPGIIAFHPAWIHYAIAFTFFAMTINAGLVYVFSIEPRPLLRESKS